MANDPRESDVANTFAMFVADAQRVLGRAGDGAVVARALDSVDAASSIAHAAAAQGSGGSTEAVSTATADFGRFVDAAVPLVVRRMRELLPAITTRVLLASRWLVHNDLLAVAGFGFVENAYTELMAWALHPQTDPLTAVGRQRAWLASVGLADAAFVTPAVPRTQVWTTDGVPDLLTVYEAFAVVVEAKTGTAEHAAPSGVMQTVAYPEAVRDRVAGRPVHVVFVTPDRTPAANPSARLTTFADFALAMATALETAARPVDGETRSAFAMLVTHFLTCGTMASVPVGPLVSGVAAWLAKPGPIADHDGGSGTTTC